MIQNSQWNPDCLLIQLNILTNDVHHVSIKMYHFYFLNNSVKH